MDVTHSVRENLEAQQIRKVWETVLVANCSVSSVQLSEQAVGPHKLVLLGQ